MLVGSPRIAPAGILYHLADGAATAGDVPHGAYHLVDQHAAALASLPGLLTQGLIAAVDDGKEAVSLLLLAEKHAVELHPLGTGQRRSFHIFRTLDKRYVDVL